MRTASIKRKTKETDIRISCNLDGGGKSRIKSPIGFFDHMLDSFCRHGLFDINAQIKGDTHVDQHHLIEDTGIVLGQVFARALGKRAGINRAGFFIFPMDEALATVALDISGRPYLKFNCNVKSRRVGDLEAALLEDFFAGMVNSLGMSLHINVSGRSDHHKIEAIFKALGKAVKQACEIDKRLKGKILSAKGVL